eukprot:c26083_g1_i3 orf=293-979(-)
MGRSTQGFSPSHPAQQFYDPLPGDGQYPYAYLPLAPRRQNRWHLSFFLRSAFGLLAVVLVGISAFFLWPRQTGIHMTLLRLEGVHVDVKRGDSIIPRVFLDITLRLRVRVVNPNYFGVDYKSVTAVIFYNEEKLGYVDSEGGKVPARSTAYVSATLNLTGIELGRNVLSLLEDLAARRVPFSTKAHFRGRIRILFFEVPMEADVSCNLVIDPEDQAILSEDCDLQACC